MRTGLGYDIHRLVPTIKPCEIPLGGIQIPCYFKVQAHSDGDVLIHALVDAMLGALALGDIGQHFPDNAAENKDRKSIDFLELAKLEIKKLGYRVSQLDSNVFLEEPKLAPHMDKIREMLARSLGLELSSVSVKAKTMEAMGPVGERKAIAAQAIVMLESIQNGHTAHK